MRRVELIPHSSFCEEVFSLGATHADNARRPSANESRPGKCSDFWLTGVHQFAHSPSPRLHHKTRHLFSRFEIGTWGVVSSYSSATASDFHGIPSTDLLTY
jgi:hypothetical protein